MRPVALGRRHGLDTTSALPDRVAAAYGRAGAAAGAQNIEESDAEVRRGRKTVCCQSVRVRIEYVWS